MRTCFLFGSGISVPAGYPPVGEITEKVLCGNEQKDEHESKVSSEETLAFTRWLKTIADAHYVRAEGRIVNYEDIFFLASQIQDDYRCEFENPALAPLLDKAVGEFLSGAENQCASGRERLNEIAYSVIRHIRRSVVSALNKEPCGMDHLDFVAEAIADVGAANVCLLTVNHDTLVEEFLRAKEIKFTDGFVETYNQVDIREWRPCLFSETSVGIHVLKLHGGVNWVRLRPEGTAAWIEDYVCIANPKRDQYSKDERGRRHVFVDELEKEVFLIGTFNKMSSYTNPVYLELYYRAFRALKCANILVTVGYGFGDKGINKLITEWLCRSGCHSLVTVDRKNWCEVKLQARGAISNMYDADHIGKQFRHIQRNLSKENMKENRISWHEILQKLETP
jgi:hypothetical protein